MTLYILDQSLFHRITDSFNLSRIPELPISPVEQAVTKKWFLDVHKNRNQFEQKSNTHFQRIVTFFCLAARVPLLCGLNFVCVCFGWTSAAARCCCPLLLSVFCVLLFCCGWYGPTELRLGSLAMSKHHRPYTISFPNTDKHAYPHDHRPRCVLTSYAGVRDTWETALFRLLWLSNAIYLST